MSKYRKEILVEKVEKTKLVLILNENTGLYSLEEVDALVGRYSNRFCRFNFKY